MGAAPLIKRKESHLTSRARNKTEQDKREMQGKGRRQTLRQGFSNRCIHSVDLQC